MLQTLSRHGLVKVPITRTEENTKRIIKIVNTALARLGGDITGLEVNEEDIADVTAEWTAFKSEASMNEIVDDLSTTTKFEMLSDDVENEVVLLHVHGGAFFLCDPKSHRPLCVPLAKQWNCRVLSPRYRLAPQTQWPRQLVDLLLAYCYLLFPPPGAPHKPFSPSQIIFSGDSSGVNFKQTLTRGLLVLSALMAIHSAQLEDVPLPAGGISLSGNLDSSFSFAMRKNAMANWEALANPHEITYRFKPSPALPESTLDRVHPYLPRMDIALHPLASPILCPDDFFKSLPPLLMNMSDGELFYGDTMYFSRRAMMCGSTLQFFLHAACLGYVRVRRFGKYQGTWKDIGRFIHSIADSDPIIIKAEKFHWDGFRDTIKDDEYITMSREELREQMNQSLANLTNQGADYI